MDTDTLVIFATAMFTILNPIGGVAIFAGMVAGRAEADRRSIAIKCSIAVAVILVATIWAGEFVLGLFGVNISSLQVAGGLMIALISLSMLNGAQSAMHDTKNGGNASGPDQDIAVVPLAMPIVAGPGAIATVIVNTHQHGGIESNIEMSAVCVAMAGIICIFFLGADLIKRVLGENGMQILTKFMGMVLLAIAMSMFATGIKGLLPGLAG
jgi:multiple antibiotic resistance protein